MLRPLLALIAVRAAGLAAPPVTGPATAGARAVSLGAEQVGPVPTLPPVDSPALAGCDAPVLQQLVASDPTVLQWVIVSTAGASDTSGELSIATLQGDRWVWTMPT